MISEKIQNKLCEQLNLELSSAYLYASMSSYCKTINMCGAAHWLFLQSKEELQHALKIYDYVLEQNGKISFFKIDQPDSNFNTLTSVFSKALTHEQYVTSKINELYALSNQEKDYATSVFLQWFISEQVEEEGQLIPLVEMLKKAGDNWQALLLIDHELGERR